MQKQEVLSYQEQFRDTVISFSPFALASTGIIKAQTLLKVDTYQLICVPYQLSMTKVILLGSFTLDEVVFFQRYKNSLAALTLSVQRPTVKEPEKIFCRCQISMVGMMKGRDRVGLIVCEFKPIPPALAELLGEHLLKVERLKAEWNDYRGKTIQINPKNSKKLGFNNYAVISTGAEQQKSALFTLAVDRIECLLPLSSRDVSYNSKVTFSLYFLKYRFTVPGRIEATSRLPSGVQRIRAELGFSPELVDILSEYFFSIRTHRDD